MTKEALKLALEALQPTPYKDDWTVAKETNKAITAIKEALANEALEKMAENARELGLDYEQEPEPVAWRYRMSVEDGYWVWNYATYIERQKDDRCEPLYTTPPQRTWVGLTDEDFLEACQIAERGNYLVAFQRIQAKLKEKNT